MKTPFLILTLVANFIYDASATTVCTASQCLDGNADVAASFSGSLTSSSSKILLIPDQYTSSSPSDVVSLISSGQSTLSLPPYLSSSASTTGSVSSLPLSIDFLPGVTAFSASYFQGKASTVSLNSTTLNNSTLQASSFFVSKNAFAVFTGSSSKPVVFYDVTPDISQLPSGLLTVQNGEATLIDVESTTCATPCSAGGQCNSQGACVCKPGFTGSSCETCAAGFFGPQCQPCPEGCTSCDEGPQGSGKCLSPPTSNAPSTCNCDNGTCDGSNGCTCAPGWTTLTSSSAGSSTKLCSDCAQGFFKDSTANCRACSQNCAACSSPSGTCTQCRAGFTTSTTDPTLCVPSTSGAATCPDGSFPQASGGCAACNALCKTCTGPTSGDCLVCGAGQANLNGRCTQVDTNGICIGTGLVVDNSKGKCDACPKNCTSCSIPNFSVISTFNTVQCTACLPGFVLSAGQCVSQCPAGQFVGSDGVSCQACDSTCASCAGSASFCLTCSGSGQFALNGKCTSQCPTNTFSLTSAVSSGNSTSSAAGSTTGGACVSCHEDCATCSGPRFDQCTSCPADRPVKTASGRCLKACNRGQFWNDVAGTCDQCSSGCATCASNGSDQCLSCPSGMVLQGGKCVQSACPNGAAGVATLGGVCLTTLLGVKPVASTPTEVPDKPSGGTSVIAQRWPFILAGGLSLLFLIIIGLIVWRCLARKRRQAKTKVFKERVEREGIVTGRARAASKFISRIFVKKDSEGDAASERRQKLRVQLRMSQNPPRNLAMAEDVDLEAMSDTSSRKARRIAQWRSELEFDSPPVNKAPSKGSRSRSSIYSDGTSLTDDSELGPEQPVARSRGGHSSRSNNRSRIAPSHVETGSVYSETSSAAASRSTRRQAGPTPKQPIRDSEFDISQMGQYASLAPLKMSQERSILPSDEKKTPGGMRPLILQAQPSVETPPPSYGFAGGVGGPVTKQAGTWQTPMFTGSSTVASETSSKLSDKNPFRQRI